MLMSFPSDTFPGPYGRSTFSVVRNLHTVPHCSPFGCTNVHSHQQSIRFLVSTALLAFVIFCLFDNSHSNWSDISLVKGFGELAGSLLKDGSVALAIPVVSFLG